jgi:hypothetical protein
MFCPNCEAEYRDGFTRCSDCGVALVEHLGEIHSNTPEQSNAPEVLWTGTDPGMIGYIKDALESAKIPYHERSHKIGPLPNWQPQVSAIFTRARDHRAANAALEDAQRNFESAPRAADDNRDDSDSSAPEWLEAGDEDDTLDVPSDYVPEDFDPDEATAEVWSGEDPTIRNDLITCLNGIGIGSATEDSNGRLRIRVTPSSQKRAREMIRQVIAAT